MCSNSHQYQSTYSSFTTCFTFCVLATIGSALPQHLLSASSHVGCRSTPSLPSQHLLHATEQVGWGMLGGGGGTGREKVGGPLFLIRKHSPVSVISVSIALFKNTTLMYTGDPLYTSCYSQGCCSHVGPGILERQDR